MASMNGTPSVSVSANSSGANPTLQTEITQALLQNGGIGRIQRTLQQRLDEAGWTEALRNYATELFRSGEATTYDEAVAKVMQAIKSGAQAANGATVAVPDLRIPEDAKESGATAVRKELDEILDFKT
ncbi:Hypothetical protein R9X50_00171500 [Acrodontium crateriforme]|uniref:Transcription and mRNA export factor SUS1 n=1 Tax=Acrodontium crateriforme TaxID=150365 RepID=A0AAQ3M2Y0_9PEZI|nr:Hypothetical protein R9X50_00171500 [Acrodontium crateriforme]